MLFTVVGACYFAFHPAFWTVPSAFLGESAAAASIGLINSVGNLGGFVGPLIMGYLVTRTHSFNTGLSYLVGSLCLSGILTCPPPLFGGSFLEKALTGLCPFV